MGEKLVIEEKGGAMWWGGGWKAEAGQLRPRESAQWRATPRVKGKNKECNAAYMVGCNFFKMLSLHNINW